MEFFGGQLSMFKFDVQSFDVVSYSTFSHSMFSHSSLGPYSTLCPIQLSHSTFSLFWRSECESLEIIERSNKATVLAVLPIDAISFKCYPSWVITEAASHLINSEIFSVGASKTEQGSLMVPAVLWHDVIRLKCYQDWKDDSTSSIVNPELDFLELQIGKNKGFWLY